MHQLTLLDLLGTGPAGLVPNTDRVYLSRRCKPLPMATSDHVQLSIPEFEDDICESGYCFV